MNKKKLMKLLLAGLFVSCAFGESILGRAHATDPVGQTKTILAGPGGEIDVKSHTDKHFAVIETGGLSDVYTVQFTIAPGGDTGWHSHPGVTLITVLSGETTEYHGDDPNCTPLVHQPGTGFTVEPNDVYVLRNEGTTDLEFFALFLVPSGEAFRIDNPDPGNCP
jgi:quercetin dioxygenase-like cupin family protein